MPTTYTKEYFANQIEKAKIQQALLEAIPANVYYFNLIITLTELLKWAVSEEYKDNVFHTAHPPTPPQASK